MTEAYINQILLPYIESVREKQRTASPALVVFDRFRGQSTPRILSLLSSNNIHISDLWCLETVQTDSNRLMLV